MQTCGTLFVNLQRFLLEMGRGFCFEYRQKRILVDQDYFKRYKEEEKEKREAKWPPVTNSVPPSCPT